MKFAVTIIAVSLAQVACVAAAPAPGNWWKGKPSFFSGAGRHRTPWSKRPHHSPLPTSSGDIGSVDPSLLPSAIPVEDAPVSAVPTPCEEPTQPEYSAPPEQPAQPEPTPSPVEANPPAQPATPAATPSTPASNSGSSSPGLVSGGKPVIDSVNDYRSKAGLPLMTWDDNLAGNAAKTGNDAGGKALAHELNPGTSGQVLVFGFDDADKCDKDTKSFTPFEIYFLSWLCERPEDPALGGVCNDIANIGRIDNEGQTGHHDILAKSSFTKIGCAFARDPSAAKCAMFPGVWACDVA